MVPPLDPRLVPFLPVVRGLAQLLGPECEVVLHDFKEMPHTIVAIENGHVTGRKVGDAPTDLMLRTLRTVHAGRGQPRVYMSSSRGKILRSLGVTLFDERGAAFGLLGINLDVTQLITAQRAIAGLTTIDQENHAMTPEGEEIFAADIREVVDGMVAKILAEKGKSPAGMSRDEKMEVVKQLEERGAFLVKRSAEQVAEALEISRYTIFSYLKQIRRSDAGDGTAAGATESPA